MDGISKALILSSIVILLFSLWWTNKSYVFDEAEIARVTRKNVGSQTFGQDHRTSFVAILKELRIIYGDRKSGLVDASQLQWVWTGTGGLVSASAFLYASSREFLIFHGTALETSGFAPRCFANISSTIVQGSVKVWNEGLTGGIRYIPGESVHLPAGGSSALQLDSSTWMVLYGRGIPLTCISPIIVNRFANGDLISLWRLCRIILFRWLHSFLPTVIAVRFL